MKRNIKKISISLLIAMAFILPSATFLADSSTEIEDASNERIMGSNSDIAAARIVNGDIVPLGEPTALTTGPVGCFPVNVVSLSLDGEDLVEPVAKSTGCYDVDMTVCKTEWDTTANDWYVVTTDNTQETFGVTPKDLYPLQVMAKCDQDFVWIQFRNYGQSSGNYVNMDLVKLKIKGDLGSKTYTTDLADPDTTKLYQGSTAIPGSVVTRYGGYPDTIPGVVNIKIPRGTYWSGCCDDIEWYYYVYSKSQPDNINRGGWMDDVCFGDFYPATIKKFVEIYKYHSEEDPDETELIYETDFEDPCEIYDNWATFDAPVWGANGAIDTWTWSSKRSNSPGHSFHNSAFDEYLPSQLDYLKLNVGGSGLDVAAYDEVEVCFSHFADGDAIIDGGITIIQDAGYVEYSFNDATWVQATEEFFDTDGAWEEECFTIDTTGESTLFVRWVWYSDPTFCYEGWFIDDVYVTGVLEGSFDEWWELVWDSHSWPQDIIGECEEYTFELPWCVYQEGTYRICGWIQTLDDCHFSGTEYYDPYCIEVEIGDVLDVLDYQLYTDPECPVEEGEDVKIYSIINNTGTLNATDVQVKITVQRGFIDTVLEDDMEPCTREVGLGNFVVDPDYPDDWFESWIDSTTGYPDRSYWHFTDYEQSGDCYLANFEEPGYKYSPNNGSEWVSSPYIFKGSDRNADCTVTFDIAWALPDDSDITWHIAIMDDSSGSLYYFTDPMDPDVGGYDGALSGGTGGWITIEDVPVSSLIQSLYGAGHTTDSDTDIAFMIFFFKSGSPGSSLPWAGIKLDNVKVKKLVAVPEPIIYTETVIVPTLNVSESKIVEFDGWEDVGVGQYVITETVLSEDDNMDNNEQVGVCNVINIYAEPEDMYCVDNTWCVPGNWVTEGCCGGVLWAGDPATTAYGNDWDTSLYIAPDGNKTLDFSSNTTITMDITTWYQLNISDVGYVETTFDEVHWDVIATFTGDSNNPPDNWEAYSYGIPNNVKGIRFRFVSNETEINRGWMIDDIVITTDGFINFSNDGTNFDDMINKQTPGGCWWNEPWSMKWFLSDHPVLPQNTWFPAWYFPYLEPSWGLYDPLYFDSWPTAPYTNVFPAGIDTTYIWNIDEENLDKAFYGWLEFSAYWDIPETDNLTATLEVSSDDGENWAVLNEFVGGSGFPSNVTIEEDWYHWNWGGDVVDMTPYLTGDELLIGWHMVATDDAELDPILTTKGGSAGFGAMSKLAFGEFGNLFYGMYEDTPPVTTITMQGTFDEIFHYYTSEVAVWLTATDDISGVAAIYYELDGTQYTYSGPFIIDGDGEHTLCYWAVDNEGNEEAKKCVAPFQIDESGPSVTISIADGPGIYIFGNKLLSSDKYIFLFGGVDVKATVTIDGAPLQTVEFYMNDQLFGEDTASPFALKCTLKNQGSATFKVIAKDVLGATATAQQVVDTYIKLL